MSDCDKLEEIIRRLKRIEDKLGITEDIRREEEQRTREYQRDNRGSLADPELQSFDPETY